MPAVKGSAGGSSWWHTLSSCLSFLGSSHVKSGFCSCLKQESSPSFSKILPEDEKVGWTFSKPQDQFGAASDRLGETCGFFPTCSRCSEDSGWGGSLGGSCSCPPWAASIHWSLPAPAPQHTCLGCQCHHRHRGSPSGWAEGLGGGEMPVVGEAESPLCFQQCRSPKKCSGCSLEAAALSDCLQQS